MSSKDRRLLYVDGEFVEPASGEWFPSTDPYTGENWVEIPDATSTDVDEAVNSAARAVFENEWADLTQTERGEYLYDLADALEDRVETHAELEVRDNGKPIREMESQHEAIPDWYRYYAGLADKIRGDTIPVHKPNKHVYTLKEPVGVVGAITPWNSPLMLATWKLAPALAAGNAVVLKPDPHTSTSALAFAEAVDDVGFPDGVVNVVTGFGDVGEEIVTHEDVDKISFTGGTDTGSVVASQASKTFKRTSMELGGKSPNIVFSDANIANAINGALAGIFTAAGQSCSAGSRLLLHDDIHDEVVSELATRAQEIRFGDPRDPATEMGPLASDEQFDRVAGYVDVAQKEGATLVTGGGPPDSDHGSERFFEPTIFTDVDNNDTIAQEEVFGPVLAVIPFGTEEEAVRIANDISFGLAAGVWTEDMRRAHRVSSSIRAGRIWINNYGNSSYTAPQGGYKESGWGRENGTEAIEEYLETKTIWLELDESTPDSFE